MFELKILSSGRGASAFGPAAHAAQVRRILSRFGTIAAVAVDRKGVNARVLLRFPCEADDAQRALDGRLFTGLADTFIRVKFSWDNYTPCWSAQYVKEYKLPHPLWATLAILSAPGWFVIPIFVFM